MGGKGSGQWRRWGSKGSAGTVEACRSLDVLVLHRAGFLTSGYMEAKLPSLTLVRMGNLLTIEYSSGEPPGDSQSVTEELLVEWTPCNYGGQRPWFICPGVVNGVACKMRVRMLYAGKYFACRHCHGLTYTSSRETRADRALRRSERILRRLGDSEGEMKPKGMHWETYHQLLDELEEADLEFWEDAARRLGVQYSTDD